MYPLSFTGKEITGFFNKWQSKITVEKSITITKLAFFIIDEKGPFLIIFMSGLILWANSVGSNSAGSGCTLIIKLRLNFEINLQTDSIVSIFFKSKLKTIVGFHTRNVPHRAHEWIHNFALKKCDGLFIHPLIGQFKKNEYKEKIIIQSNLKLINDIYKNKNIFFGLFNSYPRYAGPREALFHALIRKNYGCTHFMLGRDHAGVGKYYTKYESQKLCIEHEKYLKVKIISFKEPYLCTSCKKVVNKCF